MVYGGQTCWLEHFGLVSLGRKREERLMVSASIKDITANKLRFKVKYEF